MSIFYEIMLNYSTQGVKIQYFFNSVNS